MKKFIAKLVEQKTGKVIATAKPVQHTNCFTVTFGEDDMKKARKNQKLTLIVEETKTSVDDNILVNLV